MAVSDELFATAIGLVFNYIIIYRRSAFFGSIVYFLIGVAIISYFTTNLGKMVGFLIMFGAIIAVLFDWMKPKKKKKSW